MADVTCLLTVGEDGTVEMQVGGETLVAPILHDKTTSLIVRRLDRLVAQYPVSCERDDLTLLGTVLFGILFGGQASFRTITPGGKRLDEPIAGVSLGDKLLEALARFERAADPASRLRISLGFLDQASPLASYPWEFLFIDTPGSMGRFLSETATLIRAVPAGRPVGGPSEHLDVWVAWSQPVGMDQLTGASSMVATIQTEIARAGQVTVTPIELTNVTWEDLCDRLADAATPPDILHLIAHGRRIGAEGELAFRLPDKEMAALRAEAALPGANPLAKPQSARWVPISSLAAQLRQCLPRLVFLHACNTGAAPPGVDAFRGAAQVLAATGVPFVIAMQYEIANEDADTFAKFLYRTLGDPTATVDDAVLKGRTRLGLRDPAWAHRRFATPVVFLRDYTARLVAPRRAPPETAQPAAPAAELQICPFGDECGDRDRKIMAQGRTCGCRLNRAFVRCTNGHANKPGTLSCWMYGCNAGMVDAGAPAAPPRAVPLGLGEA